MKIDCLIPARAGSKGILKKNIFPLKKIPLIAYSICVARQSKFIRNVYVSTDSKEIAEIARDFGALTPFLRPNYLSTDKSTDREVFIHFLESQKIIDLEKSDYLVHLRPTTPGRKVEIIDKAINDFYKDKNCSSLRSAHLTKNCPFKWFKIEENYFKPIFQEDSGLEVHNMPRQMFPEVYIPNGYVDIVKPNIFLNDGVFHGKKIKVFKTDRTIDIDQLSDLERAEDDKIIIELSKFIKSNYGLSFNSL